MTSAGALGAMVASTNAPFGRKNVPREATRSVTLVLFWST